MTCGGACCAIQAKGAGCRMYMKEVLSWIKGDNSKHKHEITYIR